MVEQNKFMDIFTFRTQKQFDIQQPWFKDLWFPLNLTVKLLLQTIF